MIQLVGVNRLEALDLGFTQFRQQFFGDFIVCGSQNFTGFRVNNVLGQNTTNQEFIVNRNSLHIRHLTNMACGDAFILSDDHFTVAADDIKASDFTLQTFGHQRHRGASGTELEGVKLEERFKNLFRIHAQSLEQNRHRHLAAAVNTEIHQVLGIEFKIQPRTAVRNHSSREEQLTRAVRLTLIVFEEQTRRTVQLADDHTFGTVDDEGSFFRHERNFAHINIVFTDFLDTALSRIIAIDNLQADASAQTARIGQTAQLTFGNIKHRFIERIALENQSSQTVVAGDRENRSKG